MSVADTTSRPASLVALIADAEKNHQEQFGCAATCVVASPGRVNLIGEHIDYNDGFVMPMAIERYVVIAASPREDSLSQFVSGSQSDGYLIDLKRPPSQPSKGWAKYLEGVVHGFAKTGGQLSGFNATVSSDVPIGSGLSSSAALEVATATLLEAWSGRPLKFVEKALLCQKAEHDFAGVPCGIMDQFISVCGRPDELILLDCLSLDSQSVPFVDPDVTVLIINSKVDHELAGGEYAARRNQCDQAWAHLKQSGFNSWRDVSMAGLEQEQMQLGDVGYRRARHVVTEIARTLQAVDGFKANQWARVGELMSASHQSLRDDFNVSCNELDVLVEIAGEIGIGGGVYGSRMTGGGFGGCTVSLVRTDCVEEVRQRILKSYFERTGIEAEAFSSRPARGAHVIVPKG